jgi:hypothetical protein
MISIPDWVYKLLKKIFKDNRKVFILPNKSKFEISIDKSKWDACTKIITNRPLWVECEIVDEDGK